jgi:hypothetical protein
MMIPMPGHDILSEQESLRDIQQLEKLITEHDVVFLLTDSRESRWLPTLLSTVHEKVRNFCLRTYTLECRLLSTVHLDSIHSLL